MSVARVLRPRRELEKPIYRDTSCIQNLIVETTSLKLPNLLKILSHLVLTVLTNFSRPVRNVTLNVLSRTTVCYLFILL
jgi:hypothetical protein